MAQNAKLEGARNLQTSTNEDARRQYRLLNVGTRPLSSSKGTGKAGAKKSGYMSGKAGKAGAKKSGYMSGKAGKAGAKKSGSGMAGKAGKAGAKKSGSGKAGKAGKKSSKKDRIVDSFDGIVFGSMSM